MAILIVRGARLEDSATLEYVQEAWKRWRGQDLANYLNGLAKVVPKTRVAVDLKFLQELVRIRDGLV